MTLTNPTEAGKGDMTTYAGQIAHYSEVRARLGTVSAPPLLRRPPPPIAPYRPAPVTHKQPHDYLFINARLANTNKSSQGGIWNTIGANRIVEEVSQKHSIPTAQMRGHTRSRPVVAARWEAYFRISTELGYSLPMIGKAMGDKEHTGVMYGIRKHKERVNADV
jgi:hypothetical protein